MSNVITDQRTEPDFSNLRVAYAPNNNNLQESGDRRRFCAYAEFRQMEFEIADPEKEYDVVVLTYHCDFTKWVKYKKRPW